MSEFRIEDLVALPMQPSLRVRIGPDRVVEVDQVAWETKKDAFIEWALGLPNIHQSISYRLLKPYTGGNGMLARLVVALGDLARIWTMYPHPRDRQLWGPNHPTILSVRPQKKSRRVPKPSAGDLDTGKHCTCCLREMGPSDSQVHDLVASDDVEGLCLECDLVCGARASSCQIGSGKEKRAHRVVDTAEDELDQENVTDLDAMEFEKYASRFGD